MKFRITLIRLADNHTEADVFVATNRHEAVAKAFLCIAHKKQHECLDEWNVASIEKIQKNVATLVWVNSYQEEPS